MMNTDNEIIDLLRTVASSFQMRLKEQIAAGEPGLPVFQTRLINLVARNDGISQLDLVSLTERDKAQVARAIKELETLGLVTRSLKPSDKRTKCLTLTPEGRAVNIRLSGWREALALDTLSSLTDTEKDALRASLTKMAAQLQSC